MSKEQIYDVAIIGGGPGGYSAAITAARLGASVVLIEKNKLGGTCLNEGCIPTKALLKCAEVYASASKAGMYGVELGQGRLDFKKAMQFKSQVVSQLVGGVGHLVKAGKIMLFAGEGRIIGPHIIAVKTEQGIQELQTKNIIIATGAREAVIPGFEADGFNILNSSQMLSTRELPRKLAIIGGGVIGVEFASIFSRMGVEVTIVELTPRLIPAEDEEVSRALKQSLAKNGIDIYLEAKAKNLKQKGPGELVLNVALKEGIEKEIECGQVLVCVGREANLEGIGIREFGIKTDKGRIVTDLHMQTSVKGVYAVGDVTAGEQLAHAAYYEARTAVFNIMGQPKEITYSAIPHCIYSSPEVATVGLPEQTAKERYPKLTVSRFPFYGNGKALIEGNTEGFVKLLSDGESGRILGAAIIGPKATELIAEYTLAVNMGLATVDLVNTVHAHPTLSEALHEAALAAMGWNLHSL